MRRAHRLLLERPVLIRSRQPDEYRLVARQIDTLARWHLEHTGWPVHVDERAGVIRLRRRASLAPSGIWEPWKSDVVLSSPRDYACLVYLLWYARSPLVIGRGGLRQVLLSDLCERLAHRSALADENAGAAHEPFDFTRRRTDYYSLRRALKALEDLGAVIILDETAVAGAAGERDTSEALIEFTDVVEALIVELNLDAVRSLRERRPDPRGLITPVLDGSASTSLRRAWRTLLLGPLLLRRDDAAAFDVVRRDRDAIEAVADDLFGFVLDLTPSYARFVRPSGTSFDRSTQVLNHQQKGVVHAALLLCAAVRRRVADGELARPDRDGCLELTRPVLTAIFRQVCVEDQRRWGSELAEAKPELILGRVCDVLRVAGLLRGPDANGRVLLLPTAARYRVAYASIESGSVDATGTQSGFDSV